jgi:hypothetical protein
MSEKNYKKIRKAFKEEKGLDVLGPANRQIGSSVEKTAYITGRNGEPVLTKVTRNTMINTTKNAYRRLKKDLIRAKARKG